MSKFLKTVLCVNIAVGWIFVFGLAFAPFFGGNAPSSPDTITIVLSALAVMLAVLTIFLAVLALWGYTSLKASVLATAMDVADKAATSTASVVAESTARDVAESVAARTMRELQDQEEGQGGGDEYGAAAAAPSPSGPHDSN